MTAKAPAWLNTARSNVHLLQVARTLGEREKERSKARDNSRHRRHQTDSSLTTHYAVSVGSSSENTRKNRYLAIEPYDSSRVIVPDSRYLNASWVKEKYGGKWWIAGQATLPSTAHAFLSLLMQPLSPQTHSSIPSTYIRTIVQLTRNVESGVVKGHAYFPKTVGEKWLIQPEPGFTAAPIEIQLLDWKIVEEAQCTYSTLQVVQAPNPPRVIHHLLYEAWPDHGIPDDFSSLIAFARLADETNQNLSPDVDAPMIAGCSAGIGRTGTFIAISSLLRSHGFLSQPLSPSSVGPPESLLGPLPESLQFDKVAQEVDSLREQRGGMVGNEQLQLIYWLLLDAFVSKQVNDTSKEET